MGMVYLFTVWFGISFEHFIPLALLSLCTIIGFASFGYLMNDLFDIRQDMLAGKKNFLAGKPLPFIVLFFLFSLTFIFLPWILLPSDGFSFSLIAFQLVLFLIYSIPPLRLKERSLAGLIVDALYAHAAPPILAAYTFSLAAHRVLPGFELVLLFAWQFTSGMRNILMHQAEDMSADRKSNSRNFVSTLSDAGFQFAIKYLILTEILFSIAFFALLSIGAPLFMICIAAILVISSVALRSFYLKGIEEMLHSTWRFFPNNLYERWLPPLFLLLGVLSDPLFLIVLVVHLTLFNFNLYSQTAQRLYLAARWLQHILIPVRNGIAIAGSAFVNYSIYYMLLLFGIDLKKENTSALNYFKKRWGKNQA
jgi:ABC-type multidrug transport system fused ATPase/permease subunit